MENLISIEQLVKQAKKENVDFGDTDPYNRLRYYTKIGWLPHMVRKTDSEGNVNGHYPSWALKNLLLIEKLKRQNTPNDVISKKIKAISKVQNVLTTLLAAQKDKYRLLTYLLLGLFFFVIAAEINIIPIGKTKATSNPAASQTLPFQISDGGVGIILKNQRKVFVKAKSAQPNSKVYVTFRQDYSPATRYWVSSIDPQNGFTIALDAPVAQDTEFSWWLSQ